MFAHPELAGDFQAAKDVVEKRGELRSALTRLVDSTVLKPETVWSKVEALCKEASQYNFRAVCVSPCFVQAVREYFKANSSKVRVCTVVGFPNGVSTTASKVFETRDAISAGADEIDYVQNDGWVKSANWVALEKEAKEIVQAAQGRLVKIILETSLLTESEIRECALRSALAGFHVIKTSTGFGSRGASPKDIEIMASALAEAKSRTGMIYGIKASGGVRTLADAQTLVGLGATRLGTSGGAAIVDGAVNTASY
jgi:deoxyribose-phosphate aldolase